MIDIFEPKHVCLRKAEIKDIDLLFKWVNDEDVRKNSINTEKIEYDGHKEWFNRRLESKECDLYIYCVEDISVGQIRLDYLNNSAKISYSIDKLYRGQGHGNNMLKLAETEISKNRPSIKYMLAIVKVNNIVSRNRFEKLGYTVDELGYKKDYICYKKKLKNDGYVTSKETL